ncbi:MAG TPA: PDZ domain-containing protein, partial [Solirubrobacteraceae bacterium]|nr:PDZ domain-containing protein [Solirubrobacteraceae bacterium]
SYFHDMFGSFPFDSYTFVCASNSNAAEWGLEHLTSTMVGLEPGVFTDPDLHKTAVRVCAHELFHAWNVRRLRPAPLDRLDFRSGSFTEGLWVAEGFTRYYEFLSCTRTGVYTPEQFFSVVVNYYRHLVARPAYERVSAVDSSLATFLNHGGRYPGRVNNSIDYYDKGLVIAFCADATLRSETADSSLDRAFAAFYERFVGRGLGYTPQDLRDFLEEIHPGLGGRVYREATRPAGLTLCGQLARLGFEVHTETVGHLGLVLCDDAGPAICDVLDTSPAGQSGIAPGDVIGSLDGHPFELGALKWAIANGGSVTLSVMRGSEPDVYEIPIGTRMQITRLRWIGSDDQAKRIAAWVGQDFAPAPNAEIPLDFYENFHGIETVL